VRKKAAILSARIKRARRWRRAGACDVRVCGTHVLELSSDIRIALSSTKGTGFPDQKKTSLVPPAMHCGRDLPGKAAAWAKQVSVQSIGNRAGSIPPGTCVFTAVRDVGWTKCEDVQTWVVCSPAALAAASCLWSELANSAAPQASAQPICKASMARTAEDSSVSMHRRTTMGVN